MNSIGKVSDQDLDIKGEDTPKTEGNEAKATEPAPKGKILDFDELSNKAARGTMQLLEPIRSGGKDVTELQYDYKKLTPEEYTKAVDSDKNATNIFRLSSTQALALFAAAAGKATAGIDAKDIQERMSVEDVVAATQLSVHFFTISAARRNNRFTKK